MDYCWRHEMGSLYKEIKLKFEVWMSDTEKLFRLFSINVEFLSGLFIGTVTRGKCHVTKRNWSESNTVVTHAGAAISSKVGMRSMFNTIFSRVSPAGKWGPEQYKKGKKTRDYSRKRNIDISSHSDSDVCSHATCVLELHTWLQARWT